MAVVTDRIQEDLFEDENETLLGKIIYIGEQPVEIIGVVETETGIFSFGSNTVYLPMKTWQSIFAKTTSNRSIDSSKNPMIYKSPVKKLPIC